jgi:hypothetical protein
VAADPNAAGDGDACTDLVVQNVCGDGAAWPTAALPLSLTPRCSAFGNIWIWKIPIGYQRAVRNGCAEWLCGLTARLSSRRDAVRNCGRLHHLRR